MSADPIDTKEVTVLEIDEPMKVVQTQINGQTPRKLNLMNPEDTREESGGCCLSTYALIVDRVRTFFSSKKNTFLTILCAVIAIVGILGGTVFPNECLWKVASHVWSLLAAVILLVIMGTPPLVGIVIHILRHPFRQNDRIMFYVEALRAPFSRAMTITFIVISFHIILHWSPRNSTCPGIPSSSLTSGTGSGPEIMLAVLWTFFAISIGKCFQAVMLKYIAQYIHGKVFFERLRNALLFDTALRMFMKKKSVSKKQRKREKKLEKEREKYEAEQERKKEIHELEEREKEMEKPTVGDDDKSTEDGRMSRSSSIHEGLDVLTKGLALSKLTPSATAVNPNLIMSALSAFKTQASSIKNARRRARGKYAEAYKNRVKRREEENVRKKMSFGAIMREGGEKERSESGENEKGKSKGKGIKGSGKGKVSSLQAEEFMAEQLQSRAAEDALYLTQTIFKNLSTHFPAITPESPTTPTGISTSGSVTLSLPQSHPATGRSRSLSFDSRLSGERERVDAQEINELTYEQFQTLFHKHKDSWIILYNFFTGDRSGNAHTLSDPTKNITRASMASALEFAILENKHLQSGLHGAENLVSIAQLISNILLGFVYFIIGLSVFGVDVGNFLLAGASFLVAFSFILGASIRNTVENVFFLFVVRPYDEGDRIIVQDTAYLVKRISLSYTQLLKSDGTLRYYPNELLMRLPIDNHRRSAHQWDIVTFDVPVTVPEASFERLRERMTEFTRRESADFYPGWWAEVSGTENMNKFQAFCFCRHRDNFQDRGVWFRRRGKMLFHMAEVCRDLGIVYTMPLQPVSIEGKKDV